MLHSQLIFRPLPIEISKGSTEYLFWRLRIPQPWDIESNLLILRSDIDLAFSSLCMKHFIYRK